MTKHFNRDAEAARLYCTDGDGEIILNEYESHLEGQRHAASVLMPEIERLEKALDRALETIPSPSDLYDEIERIRSKEQEEIQSIHGP